MSIIIWKKRDGYAEKLGIILKEMSISQIIPMYKEEVFNKKKIDALEQAMRNGKHIEPILVQKSHIKNKYRIFDGNHRYYAAIRIIGKKGKILVRT
jgi:ParB-like chromosome segregation protein Spo0J